MTNPSLEQAQAPWPVELSLSPNKAILTVNFNTGDVFHLDAELLRVEAPSADVQGHGADQKQTPHGKRHVTIHSIEPVGHYAVRLTFSDGHCTGLYTWETIYRYGKNASSMMADYLNRLEAMGLARDR